MDRIGGEYVGFGAVLLAVLGFVKFFVYRQIADLRTDVADLKSEVRLYKEENERERSLKHKIAGDLSRTRYALNVVQMILAKIRCSCGALDDNTDLLAEVITAALEDV